MSARTRSMAGQELESWSGADWERLRELRGGFLRAQAGERIGAYWTSRRDLELYDASFARRIGWKWSAVLDELSARGVMPHGGTFVDFGCGTGIATRTVLERVEARRVHLLDRSPEAARFAAARVAESSGLVEIVLEAPRPDEPIDVLLASHVLDELDERGRDELLALARRARILVWVEAGSLATSRALSAIRDELLDVFDVLAPGTHRERFPVLRS